MEHKQDSQDSRVKQEHAASKDARTRNQALKQATIDLIESIMQSPIAKARLADPVKRK